MSKKLLKIMSILLVMVMVLGIAGCGTKDDGGDTTTEKPAEKTEDKAEDKEEDKAEDKEEDKEEEAEAMEPVTIRYLTFRSEDEGIFGQLIEKFQSENPHITVELETIADVNAYYQTLQANMMSGGTHDVFDIHPNTKYEEFINEGLVEDLSDLPFIDHLQDGSKAFLDFNGRIYGYQHAVNLICAIYNKDIYEKYGLGAPADWDQFVADIKTLKDNGEGGLAYIGGSVGTAWLDRAILNGTMGSNAYKEMMLGLDAGDVTELGSNEAWVTAVETMGAYNTEGIFHDNFVSTQYPQALTLFATGEVPVMMMGTWTFGTQEADYPGVNIGIFPMPNMANTGKYYAEGAQLSLVSSASENKDAAKAWVNFLATPENATIYINHAKMTPTLNGVEADYAGYELLTSAFEQGVEVLPMFALVKGEHYNGFINNVYVETMLNGMNPAEQIKIMDEALSGLDIKNLQ